MLPLALSLLALFLVAIVLGHITRRRERRAGSDAPSEPPVRQRPAGCCGQHEVCEKESLLAALEGKAEYYEDEELDAYRGRPSDAYTEAEAEEFREVMLTMRPEEVAGWVRALEVRGVALPDEVKDEAILLIGEAADAEAK